MCSTLTNQLGTALYINGVSDLQREGDGRRENTLKKKKTFFFLNEVHLKMQFYAILYRTVFSAQTEFIVLPDILSQYQRLFCCGWGGFFFAWEGDFLFCLNTNCYTHTGYYFKINC